MHDNTVRTAIYEDVPSSTGFFDDDDSVVGSEARARMLWRCAGLDAVVKARVRRSGAAKFLCNVLTLPAHLQAQARR